MKAQEQDQNLNRSQNQQPDSLQNQTDSRGVDMISGMNRADSPAQARSQASTISPSTNATTPEGRSATSPGAPEAAKQGAGNSAAGGGATWEGRERSDSQTSAPNAPSSAWQGKLQDTVKTSWQRVSDSAKNLNVSPTALAIGAAAVGVGAAAWLTRKQWMPSSGSAESPAIASASSQYGKQSKYSRSK